MYALATVIAIFLTVYILSHHLRLPVYSKICWYLDEVFLGKGFVFFWGVSLLFAVIVAGSWILTAGIFLGFPRALLDLFIATTVLMFACIGRWMLNLFEEGAMFSMRIEDGAKWEPLPTCASIPFSTVAAMVFWTDMLLAVHVGVKHFL